MKRRPIWNCGKEDRQKKLQAGECNLLPDGRRICCRSIAWVIKGLVVRPDHEAETYGVILIDFEFLAPILKSYRSIPEASMSLSNHPKNPTG